MRRLKQANSDAGANEDVESDDVVRDGRVAAGAIRDFRGAMTGRGEKGLVLPPACSRRLRNQRRRAMVRLQSTLIDGEELCDLLKQFGLGVTVKERIEEDVTVELNFFDGV